MFLQQRIGIGVMDMYAQCLYTRGVLKVASELAACRQMLDNIQALPEASPYSKELQWRHDALKAQLLEMMFISLEEMRERIPASYELLMALKDAVTDEVIADVWTEPHNELMKDFNALVRDQRLWGEISRVDNCWMLFQTLRCFSANQAFMRASVAEKAALLMMSWGELSFYQFRLLMQIFFGLTDIQLLAVLMGNGKDGGLLRLHLDKDSFVLIVEPVHCSGYRNYGDRSSFDTLLEAFYPYISETGRWDVQHWLYREYLNIIMGDKNKQGVCFSLPLNWILPQELREIPYYENEQGYIQDTWLTGFKASVQKSDPVSGIMQCRILPDDNGELLENFCASLNHYHLKADETGMTYYWIGEGGLKSFPISVRHWLLSLVVRSVRYFDFIQASFGVCQEPVSAFIRTQLSQCGGNGISLDELFKLGELEGYSADKMMMCILDDLENIMIRADGSGIRLKLPTEYKKGRYFDEYIPKNKFVLPIIFPDLPTMSPNAVMKDFAHQNDVHHRFFSGHHIATIHHQLATKDEIDDAIVRFRASQNDKLQYKNGSEMVLAFLNVLDKCIKLKDLKSACSELFKMPEPTVSRVLKSYQDKFYSCQHGVWCSRMTGLKLGFNMENME